MELITVTPKETANPYAADVAQLVKAAESNPMQGGAFVVKAKDVGKAKFKIAKAANALDRTAALHTEETQKDGTVRLVYRIKPRHQSKPRGPRKPETGQAVETVKK